MPSLPHLIMSATLLLTLWILTETQGTAMLPGWQC